MKIALGADHAGVDLKDHLADRLRDAGHEVVDLGTHGHDSTDYPDLAVAVARSVASGDTERGLLVCGTGIGMAIADNKLAGVRAANCNDLVMCRLAREHNDANVLTVGARIVAPTYAETLVDAFLATPYGGDRHQRRLDKITALEGHAPC